MSLQDKNKVLRSVLKTFGAGMRLLPMKMYAHDSDMDIVVIDPVQYEKVADRLQRGGYERRNNLSKIRETDKDFYYKPGQKYIVHLHRAFSWNTVVYLPSEPLWIRRVQDNPPRPSPEDEALIIAAHSIFENKRITTEEYNYYHLLVDRGLEYDYMRQVARERHWLAAWELFQRAIMRKKRFFGLVELNRVCWSKFIMDVASLRWRSVPRQLFTYSLVDNVWCYRHAIIAKRLAS